MDGKLHPRGTEPVNAQLHNEFVALVALFYSGELTDEEWALLQVHLAWCDSCRSTFEQYKYIASDVIPAMAASAVADRNGLPKESDRDIAEAERRLMEQLDSTPYPKQTSAMDGPQRRSWRRLAGAVAACVLVAAAFAGVHLARQRSQPLVSSSSNIPASTSVPSTAVATSNEDLRRTAQQAQQEGGEFAARARRC
jgi:hypothetical protein